MRVGGNKEGKIARAMVLATRVVCNKEGDGKSNEGNGNKGGGQVTGMRVMVMMWAMATANGNEAGGQ